MKLKEIKINNPVKPFTFIRKDGSNYGKMYYDNKLIDDNAVSYKRENNIAMETDMLSPEEFEFIKNNYLVPSLIYSKALLFIDIKYVYVKEPLQEIGDTSLKPFSFTQGDSNLDYDQGLLRGSSTYKFESPKNSYEVIVSYTGGKQSFPGSNIAIPKFMTYEGHQDTTQEGKPLQIMSTIMSIIKKELFRNFEDKKVIDYIDYLVWPASEEKFGIQNIQSKNQRNKLYKVFLEKLIPQYIEKWVDVDGYFGVKLKHGITEVKIKDPIKPFTFEFNRKLSNSSSIGNLYYLNQPIGNINVFDKDIKRLVISISPKEYEKIDKRYYNFIRQPNNNDIIISIESQYINFKNEKLIDEVKVNNPIKPFTFIKSPYYNKGFGKMYFGGKLIDDNALYVVRNEHEIKESIVIGVGYQDILKYKSYFNREPFKTNNSISLYIDTKYVDIKDENK